MTMHIPQGPGQAGIWVADQETVSLLDVNERVIGQPPDGAARGPGVAEGVPRWQQARILLVEFVLAVQNAISPVCGLISHRCS
jgi:hypothetical protein